MRSLIIPALFVSLVFFVSACQKSITDPDAVSSVTNNTNNNVRLSYGDTLFFLKNQVADYVILPVSKPNAPGYLKSIPKGLVMDSSTGRINITQSQAGLRYKIFYVSTSGTILDSVKLVISGIDYFDAIYEIASTPNAYDTAFPIYNARPQLPLPCGDDDEDDDGDIDDDDNRCVFDETDLNNDGNDDIAGVIQDKLLIDEKKGTIDVEASFHAGVFNSSNPANGISRDFTFYYRLQDASNRALNKMTVRLYHFRKRSDIPQSLLDTLRLRAGVSTAVNSRTAVAGNLAPQEADISSQRNTSISRLDLYYKPKRPPFIIIVSQ